MYELAYYSIYAHSGVNFSDPEIGEYFSQYDWYHPNIPDNQISDVLLNQHQAHNLSLLQDYVTQDSIHYYEVFNLDASSWDEAQSYCLSIGGHLATLTSKEENDYVFQIMSDAGYESAYFGLSDKNNEGIWTWVTGETVGYLNWHSGEPNSENSNEDYGMFYFKYADGTWNDGDFGGRTENGGKAFICEWETEILYNNYAKNKQKNNSPFKQTYWVVFTEGFRNSRVEASTIDSSLPENQLFIVWNSSMKLNNTSGASRCDQYYLDDNNEWVYMGTYERFTNWATNVIASNLDIRDRDGNLILPKCYYSDIDWRSINEYR